MPVRRTAREVYRVLDAEELIAEPLPELEPEPATEFARDLRGPRARAIAPALLVATLAAVAAMAVLQTAGSHRRGILRARARTGRGTARPLAGAALRPAPVAGRPAGRRRSARPARQAPSRRPAPVSVAAPSGGAGSQPAGGASTVGYGQADPEFGFERP